jgi:hypothetical protein
MKKTGLLLLLMVTATSRAPAVDDGGTPDADGIVHGGKRAIRAFPDANRGRHLLRRIYHQRPDS